MPFPGLLSQCVHLCVRIYVYEREGENESGIATQFYEVPLGQHSVPDEMFISVQLLYKEY